MKEGIATGYGFIGPVEARNVLLQRQPLSLEQFIAMQPLH